MPSAWMIFGLKAAINFANILRAAFATFSLHQNVKKLRKKHFCTKKGARKILVKLIPGSSVFFSLSDEQKL